MLISVLLKPIYRIVGKIFKPFFREIVILSLLCAYET